MGSILLYSAEVRDIGVLVENSVVAVHRLASPYAE
jgi:hypothetical protein